MGTENDLSHLVSAHTGKEVTYLTITALDGWFSCLVICCQTEHFHKRNGQPCVAVSACLPASFKHFHGCIWVSLLVLNA